MSLCGRAHALLLFEYSFWCVILKSFVSRLPKVYPKTFSDQHKSEYMKRKRKVYSPQQAPTRQSIAQVAISTPADEVYVSVDNSHMAAVFRKSWWVAYQPQADW